MTIKNAAFSIALVLCGWLAVLMTIMVASDNAPAALVVFPSERFLSQLPDGVSLVSSSPVSVTLMADAPNFAGALYKSGAWIVLPAGLAGCTASPPTELSRG